MTKRIAATNFNKLCEQLTKVPEVRKACAWIKTNPQQFNDLLKIYLDLVASMQNYSELDLKAIKEANRLMLELNRSKSESNLSAAELLQALSKEQRKTLKQTAAQAFGQNSPHFEKASAELVDMMYAGHEKFASGSTPRDGDSESDRVIWGHTQAREVVDPKVLAHFIIGHYLARYMSHAYPRVPEVQTKDGFLAAMIDIILLQEARKPGSQIYETWVTSREEGGLGWIIPEYLDIYQKLVEDNKILS